MGKSHRFEEVRGTTPGPKCNKLFNQDNGHERVSINPNGTYCASKFRSTNAGVFGRSKRHDPLEGKYAPGPGA